MNIKRFERGSPGPIGLTEDGPRSETDTLSLIRTSFASHDRIIERAYRDSRSFRDLCGDYRRCVAVLHRWEHRDEPESDSRRQEYTQLLAELTDEIDSWFEALKDLPTLSDGSSG